MANLTKEYLDSKFKALDSKLSSLDGKLNSQTKELKSFVGTKVEKEIERLAVMVNKGFADIEKRLDVVDRVERLEKMVFKISEALNVRS